MRIWVMMLLMIIVSSPLVWSSDEEQAQKLVREFIEQYGLPVVKIETYGPIPNGEYRFVIAEVSYKEGKGVRDLYLVLDLNSNRVITDEETFRLGFSTWRFYISCIHLLSKADNADEMKRLAQSEADENMLLFAERAFEAGKSYAEYAGEGGKFEIAGIIGTIISQGIGILIMPPQDKADLIMNLVSYASKDIYLLFLLSVKDKNELETLSKFEDFSELFNSIETSRSYAKVAYPSVKYAVEVLLQKLRKAQEVSPTEVVDTILKAQQGSSEISEIKAKTAKALRNCILSYLYGHQIIDGWDEIRKNYTLQRLYYQELSAVWMWLTTILVRLSSHHAVSRSEFYEVWTAFLKAYQDLAGVFQHALNICTSDILPIIAVKYIWEITSGESSEELFTEARDSALSERDMFSKWLETNGNFEERAWEEFETLRSMSTELSGFLNNNRKLFSPGEQLVLSVSLRHCNHPVDGAEVSYEVKTYQGITIKSGICEGKGNGKYEAIFPAPNNPGNYLIEVKAETLYQKKFLTLRFEVRNPCIGHNLKCFLTSSRFQLSPGEKVKLTLKVENIGKYDEKATAKITISGVDGSEYPLLSERIRIKANETLIFSRYWEMPQNACKSYIVTGEVETDYDEDFTDNVSSQIIQREEQNRSYKAYSYKGVYLEWDSEYQIEDFPSKGGFHYEWKNAPNGHSYEIGLWVEDKEIKAISVYKDGYRIFYHDVSKPPHRHLSTSKSYYFDNNNLHIWNIYGQYKRYLILHIGVPTDEATLQPSQISAHVGEKVKLEVSPKEKGMYESLTVWKCDGSDPPRVLAEKLEWFSLYSSDGTIIARPKSPGRYKFAVEIEKTNVWGGYLIFGDMDVHHYYDVEIEDILVPGRVKIGEEATIKIKLRNLSSTKLNDISVYLAIKDSNDKSVAFLHKKLSLDRNREALLDFKWETANLSPGIYQLLPTVYHPKDMKKENNTLSQPKKVVLEEPPSLTVKANLDNNAGEYREGDEVKISAYVKDDRGSEITDAVVRAIISRSNKEVRVIVLKYNPHSKRYEASYTPFTPGDYAVAIEASKTGYKSSRRVSLKFRVKDDTPPASITDLKVVSVGPTSVIITWTAPGDNGNCGTASQYDIRYSTAPISEENWDKAVKVENTPSPGPPGTREIFAITGLNPKVIYYFAIKTADEIPNWSKLSNIALAKTKALEIILPSETKQVFKTPGSDVFVKLNLDLSGIPGLPTFMDELTKIVIRSSSGNVIASQEFFDEGVIKGERTYRLKLDENAKPGKYRVDVETMVNGRSFTCKLVDSQEGVNVIPEILISNYRKIRLDGKINDWYGIQPAITGRDSIDACWIANDDEYLYLSFKFEDPSLFHTLWISTDDYQITFLSTEDFLNLLEEYRNGKILVPQIIDLTRRIQQLIERFPQEVRDDGYALVITRGSPISLVNIIDFIPYFFYPPILELKIKLGYFQSKHISLNIGLSGITIASIAYTIAPRPCVLDIRDIMAGAKLIEKVRTGSKVDVEAIANDPEFNATLQGDYAVWEEKLDDYISKGEINPIIGYEKSPLVVRIAVSKSGDFYLGTFYGALEDNLLVFARNRGVNNYCDFNGNVLDNILSPCDYLTNLDARQNYLAYIFAEVYKALIKKNYITQGPRNYYELYNCNYSLENHINRPITVVRTFLYYNQPRDPRLIRIDEARNIKWAPTADILDQGTTFQRSFDIKPQNVTASLTWIKVLTSGSAASFTLYGIKKPPVQNCEWHGKTGSWIIVYDPMLEAYIVRCNGHAEVELLIPNQLPTGVKMETNTSQPHIELAITIATLGDVSVSNCREFPTGSGPSPMRWIISSLMKENTPSNPERFLGDVSGNGSVTSFDAALVLQHSVGLITLSQSQIEVADVSGNGTVSAYDAALILRFAVGLIDKFPITEKYSQAPSRDLLIRTLSLEDVRGRVGEKIKVPIKIDNPRGIIAGEVEIEFDPEVLKFIGLSSSFMTEFSSSEGSIRLAFAAPKEKIDRTLIWLEFELTSDERDYVELKFKRGVLNENMKVNLKEGRIYIVPLNTVVLQSYPNPANSDVWLPFKLAEDGKVVVRIYDVSGKLVRTLNLGYLERGSYVTKGRAAHWDGRNERGEKVSSGVYFYELQVGRFKAVKRLVLCK